MLITNTPNDELHIYNNDGEEILAIGSNGVTKSTNQLTITDVRVDTSDDDFLLDAVICDNMNEEDTFALYKELVENVTDYYIDLSALEDTEYHNFSSFKLVVKPVVLYNYKGTTPSEFIVYTNNPLLVLLPFVSMDTHIVGQMTCGTLNEHPAIWIHFEFDMNFD